MNQAVIGKVKAEGELFFYDRFWKEIEKIGEKSLSKLLDKDKETLGWHHIKEFNLDVARTNERITGLPADGDCIVVVQNDGAAEIKLNHTGADAFDLAVYKRIKHHFEDLYLTNTAQTAGYKLKLIIGKGDWGIEETYPKIDLSGVIRNDLLAQITDANKIGQIISNTHVIAHADIAVEKILVSGSTRLDTWRNTDDLTFIAPGKILLKSSTTLADWRHATDQTFIDGGKIYTHSIEADRLNIARHLIAGATWTDNSPSAGYVAWSGAKVTYGGNTYTITNGNSKKAYIWWDFSLSTTTFQASATRPTLADEDFIVAYNDSGTHILIWNSTLIDGRVIRTGTLIASEILVSGSTYLSDWRHASDLTKIDGGNVYTNTITATQLNVTQLDAISANIGTLTTGTITNGITVDASWRQIYDNTLGANATSVTLSGLDGNTDLDYFISVLWIKNGTATCNFGIQLNGDTGVSNYGWRNTYNGLDYSDMTYFMMPMGRADTDGYFSQGMARIFAKTGKDRTMLGQFSREVGGSNITGLYLNNACWWNTASNITSIKFLSEVATGLKSGTYIGVWVRRA